MIKKKNNENGFVSIEAIIVGSVFVYGALLAVGFYIFVITQNFITTDIISFTKKVERNGGITEVEVDEFKEYLISKYSYLTDVDEIEILLLDADGNDLINPYDERMQVSEEYLSRKHDDTAIFKIKLPSNNKVLSSALMNTTNKTLDFYGYSKLIYSERY